MGNNRKLQFAIRAALAAAAATAVVPVALAQTATTTTAPAADTALQEVVVTGSRIQSLNIQSISPISTVSAVDIQATGLTRVEDILNNLPMVFAGQNSTVSTALTAPQQLTCAVWARSALWCSSTVVGSARVRAMAAISPTSIRFQRP